MKSLLFGMLLLLSANVWALPGENETCNQWNIIVNSIRTTVTEGCNSLIDLTPKSTPVHPKYLSQTPFSKSSQDINYPASNSAYLRTLHENSLEYKASEYYQDVVKVQTYHVENSINKLSAMTKKIVCDEKTKCDAVTNPADYCDKCLDPPVCVKNKKGKSECLNARNKLKPEEVDKEKEKLFRRFQKNLLRNMKHEISRLASVEGEIKNLYRASGNNPEVINDLYDRLSGNCSVEGIEEFIDETLNSSSDGGQNCRSLAEGKYASESDNKFKSIDDFLEMKRIDIFSMKFKAGILDPTYINDHRGLTLGEYFKQANAVQKANSNGHNFSHLSKKIEEILKSPEAQKLADSSFLEMLQKRHHNSVQSIYEMTQSFHTQKTPLKIPLLSERLLAMVGIKNPNEFTTDHPFVRDIREQLLINDYRGDHSPEDRHKAVSSIFNSSIKHVSRVCTELKNKAKMFCYSHNKNRDDLLTIGDDTKLPPFFYHFGLRGSESQKRMGELMYCRQIDAERRKPIDKDPRPYALRNMRVNLDSFSSENNPGTELMADAIGGGLGLRDGSQSLSDIISRGPREIAKLIEAAGRVTSDAGGNSILKDPLVDGKVAAQYSEKSQSESKSSTFTDSFNNNFGQGYSPSSPISAESDSQSSNSKDEDSDKSNRESASSAPKKDSSSELAAIMARLDAMEKDKIAKEKEIEELKKKGDNSSPEYKKLLSDFEQMKREMATLKQERDNRYTPQEIARAKRQEEEQQPRAISNPPTASSARAEASKEQLPGVKSEVRTTASLPATTSGGRTLVDLNEGFKKAPPAPVSFQLVKTNSGEEIPVFRGDKFDPSKDYGVAMIYVPDPKVKGRYQVYQKIDGAGGYVLMGDKLIDLNSKEAASKDTGEENSSRDKTVQELKGLLD